MGEVHRGVRGFVMDEEGRPVEGASLKVMGRDVGFQTTKYGEYWRVLLPGRYSLEVRKKGTKRAALARVRLGGFSCTAIFS